MASVERTDVDGIPVFWAPAPGAFRATLLFRVDDADAAEKFASRLRPT